MNGHFDKDMKWLDSDLKAHSAGLNEKGFLLDYKIYVFDSPRRSEGDIFKSVEGSQGKADRKQAARGRIRELMAREIILK
jgi:hypothetical protein